MKRIFTISFVLLFFNSVFSQGDCTSQVALCSGGVAGTVVNGTNDSEVTVGLGNNGCLGGGESNNKSYWYSVCFSTTGTFRFTLNPGGGAFNDMDWAVWGPNPACPIGAGLVPVRCSYAVVSGGSKLTGINTANNGGAGDITEGAGGNQWVDDLNVVAGNCYRICINNYGAGSNNFTMTTGGSATVDCLTALPIELLAFTAHLNTNQVDLTWITATETNNDYFTIQKSKDVQIFEDVFVVDGAGNSSTIINYFDIDKSPYTGIAYYRLKQTDFAGHVSYSNIVPIEYNPNGESSISLFPNPVDANTQAYLELNQFEGQEILVVLRDVTGREIYSKIVVTQSNNELVALNQDGKLAKGVYLITASSSNKLYSKKLIVK